MTGSFRKTIFGGLILLALVGAVAAWKYLSGRQRSGELVLSGTIEADEIHVGSKIGGRIAAVLVNEGQQVARGQALVRFERYDLDARRADAAAAVAEAEANLEKMLHWSRPEEVAQARAEAEAAWMNLEIARQGPREQEIEAGRAQVKEAEAAYEVARASFDRIERLTRDGVVSRQEFDDARGVLDRAAAKHEAARQELDLLLAGTRKEEVERREREYRQMEARRRLVERGARREDIEGARAKLERERAGLRAIETHLGELEVKAPAAAFVEVLKVRPGDLIIPETPVATLVEVDRLWVRVYVPEPELGHVRLEKEVSAFVDTFPKESFGGRVEHIAKRGEFTPRNVQTREERAHQVFAVRVRLTGNTHKLRAGMAADVVILK